MWSKVRVEDEGLLTQCAEMFSQANPSVLTVDVATLRSGIAHGAVEVFHYAGAGFEAVLEFLFSPRRARYLVCTAFRGVVEAGEVLDQIVVKGQEFVQQHQQPELYALRPTGVPVSPLTQLYDLLLQDARLLVNVEGRTSDSDLWRIRAGGAP